MADILALMTAERASSQRVIEGRAVETETQAQISGPSAPVEAPRQEATAHDTPAVAMEFDGYKMVLSVAERARISDAMTVALATIITGTEPGNTRWADPQAEFTVRSMDGTTLVLDAHDTMRFGTEMVRQSLRP